MQVMVAAVDDTHINPEYLDGLAVPCQIGTHDFVWHESWPTQLTAENYCSFIKWLSGDDVPRWQRLNSAAVIFFDLVLGVSLDQPHLATLTELLGSDNINYTGYDKEAAGLFAIATALQNKDWHGSLIVASQMGGDFYESAVKHLAESQKRKDIVIDFTTNSIAATRQSTVNAIIDTGIQKFLSRFGSIEYRLWPTHVTNWFSSENPNVPHNIPSDVGKFSTYKKAVRSYLEGLLLFEPPTTWFTDEQFPKLIKELKGLIGSTSDAQRASGAEHNRNLTLGGVVLLLAAATTPFAKQWVETIEWKTPTPVLPRQTQEQAKAAILALADQMFPPLSTHDDPNSADSGKALVKKVNITTNRLEITLGFDCTQSSGRDRTSLLNKVLSLKAENGQIYTGYRTFLIESSKAATGGREARCVMNVFPEPNKKEWTRLEIVPCGF